MGPLSWQPIIIQVFLLTEDGTALESAQGPMPKDTKQLEKSLCFLRPQGARYCAKNFKYIIVFKNLHYNLRGGYFYNHHFAVEKN